MNIGFQTSGLSGFTRVAYLWRRHASAVLWIAMAALLPTLKPVLQNRLLK